MSTPSPHRASCAQGLKSPKDAARDNLGRLAGMRTDETHTRVPNAVSARRRFAAKDRRSESDDDQRAQFQGATSGLITTPRTMLIVATLVGETLQK